MDNRVRINERGVAEIYEAKVDRDRVKSYSKNQAIRDFVKVKSIKVMQEKCPEALEILKCWFLYESERPLIGDKEIDTLTFTVKCAKKEGIGHMYEALCKMSDERE
jgi:hypothetical protein